MIYTIIGNGESRKDIIIKNIPGIRVGCNGIYLHDNVEMICAMDKFWRDKIVQETRIPIISRYTNTIFQGNLQTYNYQEQEWQNLLTPYRNYCSGTSALDHISNISTKDDYIFLIGFDFDYTGNKVNHIYKDTKFHPNSNRKAQDEGKFLKQTIEILNRYCRNYCWVTDSNMHLKNSISIKTKEFIRNICKSNSH